MLLFAFTGPVLGTNCYVLAPDGGRDCVIVDPGIGLDEQVDAIMAEHSLRPAAALVTHGHLDHTFALAQLCQRHDLPVYLHQADAYRLADPLRTLGPELAQAFAGLADDWTEPPDIRPLTGDDEFELAGVKLRAIHAPGHTEGSTLYYVPQPDPDTAHLCFTGDVLFAGTVGRTDLPGGDPTAMRETLRWLATSEADGGLPGPTTVLPGHGEASTMSQERENNPFLREHL